MPKSHAARSTRLNQASPREPTTDPSLGDLVAGSSAGIGFLNTDLRYVQGNAVLAAAFGVSSVIDRTPSDLGAPGDRTDALLRTVLHTGGAITIGSRQRRVTYSRVVDDEGSPLGIGVVTAEAGAADHDIARLQREAGTDGLTGLANHRVFQERVKVEVARALRHARPLALAMFDIDGFKQLNDTFGHQVGDDVLTRIAAHLSASVRTSDTVARLGGDEFALLLPETDAVAAVVVAERVHDRLRRDVDHPGMTVTVSTGICDLEFASSASDLIRYADGALFWTKAHGRNAICRYSPGVVEDLSAEQRGDRLLRDKALAGIRSLARAIDAKDHSTLLHSERVASLAGRLAESMGWPPARVASLREVALIHDVGKIGVPLDILLKAGPLTASEYAIVKTHVALGTQIAAEVFDDEQRSWLHGHHENYDGSGYPEGLAAQEIPEAAAILRVADSWDVMTTPRPYSEAMSPTEAIAECRRCSGRQFDPAIVAVLTRPSFERVLRMFANEQTTRDKNEAQFAASSRTHFVVRCECGTDNCDAVVEITAAAYRAVRRADRRYIVAIGHEIPEIEETLSTTPHYQVVEKS